MDIRELLEKKEAFQGAFGGSILHARLVTSFRRRKKLNINLETKVLIAWR